MAKRGATSQLTSDNWQDETVDEAGNFAKADEAEIRARLIKKAKRSTGNLPSGGGGIFSGVKLCSNGAPSSHVTDTKEDDYLHQLECLNTSVAEWISEHVKRNPLVDLTPIFRDYEGYLRSLDEQRKGLKQPLSVTRPVPVTMETVQTTSATTETVPSSCLGAVQSETSDHVISTTVTTTSTAEETSQDSDDGDTPIVALPKHPTADQLVKDDSSLLAVRSKLFYKKDNSYVELGVGVLRVREEQSKVILLMRNDTQLGNVLLNISLSSQLPVSRAGKNNVLLMCPPNPPLDFKSTNQNEAEKEESSKATAEVVTYLIRVKTNDIADKLYELVKQLQAKLS